MTPQVQRLFGNWSETLEGSIPCMYLDVLGLVTTGIGCKIDPLADGVRLPWMIGSNQASESAIRIEWNLVKDHDELARLGWRAAMATTCLRLSPMAILQLLDSRAAEMEEVISSRVPGWGLLPDRASLAVMLMSWACGPRLSFPNFFHALIGGDWMVCSMESHMDERGNPGLARRNRAVKRLFDELSTGEDGDIEWAP